MEQTKSVLGNSENFLTENNSRQVVMDFVRQYRNIDANSRGSVVYTTGHAAEQIVDPMIYGGTKQLDKTGLNKEESEQTDNLQEQITLIEDICNDPQKSREIHAILKTTQGLKHANLIGKKLIPLEEKLKEFGIQSTNYPKLARQLRNGMTEFWKEEEETKKEIKKSLVDRIELPECAEDKEECLRNIDQCVDCIYDFQELMFATNMFGPLFRFATLESNA